jgi:hypothetical protein
MDSERYGIAGKLDDQNLATRQIATAHSSIAEIYLTDLCDEMNAEQLCENSLSQALKTDEHNIDAL